MTSNSRLAFGGESDRDVDEGIFRGRWEMGNLANSANVLETVEFL